MIRFDSIRFIFHEKPELKIHDSLIIESFGSIYSIEIEYVPELVQVWFGSETKLLKKEVQFTEKKN